MCRTIYWSRLRVLADAEGKIFYGGYVDWIHIKEMKKAIARIRRGFSSA